MKTIVETTDLEGLEKLLGERVTLFCLNYIYSGKLIGVNKAFVKLSDCGVVYSTGDFKDKAWADYQKLPNDWYVVKSAIESFGLLK